MPPLVFDFADIASRLRRDDFYTPTPKPTAKLCLHCDSPDTVYQTVLYSSAWFCNNCQKWFS